jgi:putative hydrolase of the HAD superfamily
VAKGPEVIIFDVGDTLISVTRYERRRGIAALLERAERFWDGDVEELVIHGTELDRELEARCAARNLEYSQRSFHRLLYGTFGIRFTITDAEVEQIYWNEALEFELEPALLPALEAVRQAGYRMAIISNTTFSARVIGAELAKQGIGDFFEMILTSADLGIRKPDTRIFHTAAGLLGVAAEKCWYVGNSAVFDVLGSSEAGMMPFWYNRYHREAHLPPGAEVFDNWARFPELLPDG